jgi:hypothetical protein
MNPLLKFFELDFSHIRRTLDKMAATLADLEAAQAATKTALEGLATQVSAFVALGSAGTPADFTPQVAAETAVHDQISAISASIPAPPVAPTA